MKTLTVRNDLRNFVYTRMGTLDVVPSMAQMAGQQIKVDKDLKGEGFWWNEDMFEETKTR